VTLLVLAIIKWRPTFKQWRGLFVHALISTALAGALIGATVLFPLPSSRNVDFADALRSRAGGDAAITSRWKLLGPMWEGVVERPVLGQGFGYPVTFTTDDPRVRAINPTGEWTTYSMEWGWLELWLKMGLMGPLSFAFLLVWLVRGLFMAHQGRLWLSIGMSASLVFLGVTHTFSPYLNHPIGIGFILFCLIFTDRDGIPSMMKVRQPSVLQQKVSSVAISSVRDGSG
jgi:O-antigen ligase